MEVTVTSYLHQLPTTAQVPVEDASRVFYVTCRDAGRVGWLLGPYETHQEAIESVDTGRSLAIDMNPWAHFYEFGTASLPRDGKQPSPVFEKL